MSSRPPDGAAEPAGQPGRGRESDEGRQAALTLGPPTLGTGGRVERNDGGGAALHDHRTLAGDDRAQALGGSQRCAPALGAVRQGQADRGTGRLSHDRVADERYRFVVVPGHEDSAIERVVETYPGHLVVEKIGEAREQIDRDHPQERHRP